MKKVVIFSISEDTEEIRSLLQTLGMEVIKEFVQNRPRPHRESFLGPGKVDEILKEMEEMDVDLIVVNGVLKPSQHHFLEMKFQKECADRTGAILRIFTDHAHTPEAIAQVTLAKLRYELPFLREWIHKSKSGDRPGFLSGGAYATDVYFEHAKTHARKIEANLSEVSKQREVTRTRRREKGYSLVSLAGYTNAGKSALMNKL
jgi:GTP-binding protein HflX